MQLVFTVDQVLLLQIYRSRRVMTVKAVGTAGGSGRTSQGEQKSEEEVLQREVR